jgi:pSer/pThr/pTyr-binding forkhead associated (FHA) protein
MVALEQGEGVIDPMTAKLVVLQGRPAGKTLTFPDGIYYFGRGEECHVRPNSEWVSRQHCLLRVAGDVVSLRDLGSRNGTLVNGARVEGERVLADGDQVQVGPLVFQLHLIDSELPARDDTAETATFREGGSNFMVSTDEFPVAPPPSRDRTPGG